MIKTYCILCSYIQTLGNASSYHVEMHAAIVSIMTWSHDAGRDKLQVNVLLSL